MSKTTEINSMRIVLTDISSIAKIFIASSGEHQSF